jgi:hypothetical protein
MLQKPLTDTINALKDTGFPKPAFWFLLLGCAMARHDHLTLGHGYRIGLRI